MTPKDKINRMQRQLKEIELIKWRLAEKMDRANIRVNGGQQKLDQGVEGYISDTETLIQQTRQRVADISSQAARELQLSNQQTERQLRFMAATHQMEMAATQAHQSVRMGVPVYHSSEVIDGELEDA